MSGRPVLRTADENTKPNAEPTRRGGTTRLPSGCSSAFLSREYAGNEVFRTTRGKHLAGWIFDPECQKTGGVVSRRRENRLGFRPKPVPANCPGGKQVEEMVNTHPPGKLRRPLLLLLQRVGQHLLPIRGDCREPLVNLIAENLGGGDVRDTDQDRAIECDEHADEQGQLPDDRPAEQRPPRRQKTSPAALDQEHP